MNWRDGLALVLMAGGLAFFLVGTVALLRLPDAASRLHALTKVDMLGLGLVVLGLLVRTPELLLALKLLLVWLLVLLSGSAACSLVMPPALRPPPPGATRETAP